MPLDERALPKAAIRRKQTRTFIVLDVLDEAFIGHIIAVGILFGILFDILFAILFAKPEPPSSRCLRHGASLKSPH